MKQIPVVLLEFKDGGNTIWVHGPEGGTVLRIKCTGKIRVNKCAASPIAHADLMVTGDIEFCVPSRRRSKQ